MIILYIDREYKITAKDRGDDWWVQDWEFIKEYDGSTDQWVEQSGYAIKKSHIDTLFFVQHPKEAVKIIDELDVVYFDEHPHP